MNKATLLYCISLLLPPAVYADPPITDSLIEAAINGEHRSQVNKQRDIYRHPQETLKFFAIDEYMTIVEIWPGGGWYTDILAPLLKDYGTLYAAHFAADSEVPYFQKSLANFKNKLASNPAIYKSVKLTELQPPAKLEIAPPGSADRVLTFRNVHNWMKAGQAEAVFAAMYNALRVGGLLGVVEHRMPQNAVFDPLAKSGYVHENYVIKLAENAGFKLLDTSEINANPKDTGNHPKGVWTLPPSLRLKDQQQKYIAIGESDRMTLKFIKPKPAK